MKKLTGITLSLQNVFNWDIKILKVLLPEK